MNKVNVEKIVISQDEKCLLDFAEYELIMRRWDDVSLITTSKTLRQAIQNYRDLFPSIDDITAEKVAKRYEAKYTITQVFGS